MLRFAYLALFLVVAFAAVPLQAWAQEGASVPTINAQQLKSILSEKGSMFLLDVRQPDEYKAGHIDNAVLIPLNELEKRYSEIPRDKKVVVYCHSGRRSGIAVDFLRSKGFSNVESLEGGIVAWEKAQGRK